MFQVRVPPPLFEITMDLESGESPTVVEKESSVVLTRIAGCVTWTVIGTEKGLPRTALPVAGSTAVTFKLVL